MVNVLCKFFECIHNNTLVTTDTKITLGVYLLLAINIYVELLEFVRELRVK